MTERIKLVIVGAGGFGQEVIWAAENFNRVHPTYDILGFCDDARSLSGRNIYGYPVLGQPEVVNKALNVKPAFVCAIGDNAARQQVVSRVLSMGWLPVTVIDPSVTVARGVSVGNGTYVGAGSILSPNAQVGCHVIINHHCTIGHDSTVHDFAQIAPGGRVSGSCTVRQGAFLGSNGVLAPGKVLGEFATLSASSFAVANVADGATAVGVPARAILVRSLDSNTHNDAA